MMYYSVVTSTAGNLEDYDTSTGGGEDTGTGKCIILQN